MKRASAFLAALVVASLALVPTASAALEVPREAVREITGVKSSGAGGYIVLLADAPAVAYQGELPGLAPTVVAAGAKLDTEAPAVQDYVSYLVETHNEILRTVGADPAAKLYDYTYAGNGFAVELTALQAARVATDPAVLAVFPDEVRRLSTDSARRKSSTTDSSTGFLELDHQQGPWASGYTGEDVVVGVIDTGIWPEHPSFADQGYGARPAGYTATECAFGSAVPGATEFNDDDADFACNNKVLAAKAYGRGFHSDTGDGLAAGEYLSARDADGHGSHTASTAAGNTGVQASVLGADWGTISGVAPRARVAAYKACWGTAPGEGRCATSDVVAAIDDAVADGVDIINYSVGSGSATIGPDDLAFLFASAAGVLVATAAGNDGPTASTVDSPASAPWVTTVAAATRDLALAGTVTLGDGTPVSGSTLTSGTGEAPLVDAGDLGNETCDPAVEFGAEIEGAIVLCDGGGVATVDKSRAVHDGGGAGVILTNLVAEEPLDTDNHHVPSLYVSAEDGEAIAEYVEGAGTEAVATLSGGIEVEAQGSVMAAFSSRGPNRMSADVITPDVTAPGVAVMAAQTPTALQGAPGELFQALSGTSMASPHVAGVYALLQQAHPEWTPAMAKSALVSTGRHSVWKEDGTTPAQVFDMGGGYIQPGGIIHRRGSAFNPGLVYDAGLPEYMAFVCAAALEVAWAPGTCERLADEGHATDPSNLNLPSIGISELVGSQTITRTVTSVADKLRVFEAKVKAPAGFRVEVSPPTLTLGPGESADFTVTFTRTRATLGEWSYGSLAWASSGYRVVSPIALRAVDLDAPEELASDDLDGDAAFDLSFGYKGAYSVATHGLVAATTEDAAVPDDPENDINAALATGVGVVYHWVDIPEETALTRLSLSDELTDGDDDLDLYVFAPDGEFLTGSGSDTSAEKVDFVPEEAGRYTVAVHGFQTDGPDAEYTLAWWSVPSEPGGSLRARTVPPRARIGATGTIVLEWDGLEPDTGYLGAVSHTSPGRDGDPQLVGLTLVAVEGSGPAQTVAPLVAIPIPDRLDPIPPSTRPD